MAAWFQVACIKYLVLTIFRRCDPTYNKKNDASTYLGKFTRGAKNSNIVRRIAGGYTSGMNGPCNARNLGASKNFFHMGKAEHSSLEEFPMAFMVEGGLTDILDSELGHRFLVDVKRSTTFRCIEEKENKCKLKFCSSGLLS